MEWTKKLTSIRSPTIILGRVASYQQFQKCEIPEYYVIKKAPYSGTSRLFYLFNDICRLAHVIFSKCHETMFVMKLCHGSMLLRDGTLAEFCKTFLWIILLLEMFITYFFVYISSIVVNCLVISLLIYALFLYSCTEI